MAVLTDLSDPLVLAETLDAIRDVVEETGRALTLCCITDHPRPAVRRLVARHAPAALVLSPELAWLEEAEEAARALGLAVLSPREDDPETLRLDRMAMFGLVSWLISLGHNRIGYIGGPDGSPVGRQRDLGFLDALAEHGLDRGPALIEDGDGTAASGAAAARVLLEISPRPSAIVAASDLMAVGAIDAVVALGLSVPSDVSVAGFGNDRRAALSVPPLASVSLPWGKVLRRAAQALLLDDGRAFAGPAPEPRILPRASVTAHAS